MKYLILVEEKNKYKNLAKKFKNIFGNHNTKIVYKKIRVGDIKNAQASLRKIKNVLDLSLNSISKKV